MGRWPARIPGLAISEQVPGRNQSFLATSRLARASEPGHPSVTALDFSQVCPQTDRGLEKCARFADKSSAKGISGCTIRTERSDHSRSPSAIDSNKASDGDHGMKFTHTAFSVTLLCNCLAVFAEAEERTAQEQPRLKARFSLFRQTVHECATDCLEQSTSPSNILPLAAHYASSESHSCDSCDTGCDACADSDCGCGGSCGHLLANTGQMLGGLLNWTNSTGCGCEGYGNENECISGGCDSWGTYYSHRAGGGPLSRTGPCWYEAPTQWLLFGVIPLEPCGCGNYQCGNCSGHGGGCDSGDEYYTGDSSVPPHRFPHEIEQELPSTLSPYQIEDESELPSDGVSILRGKKHQRSTQVPSKPKAGRLAVTRANYEKTSNQRLRKDLRIVDTDNTHHGKSTNSELGSAPSEIQQIHHPQGAGTVKFVESSK